MIEAVVEAIGNDRTGLRLSPTNPYNDMSDSDPVATFSYACRELNKYNQAYLHILEALSGHPLAFEGLRVAPTLRQIYNGIPMLNGGYDQISGEQAISNGAADLIAYGVTFIANPDLIERFRLGAELNPPDQSTFYTSGADGYTNYPFMIKH